MVEVALVMMNTFTKGINNLNPKFTTDGNAASSTIRQIGGSLEIALSMTLVTFGFNSAFNNSHVKSIALINGYHYGFILMLIVAIIGIVLLFLLPKQSKSK